MDMKATFIQDDEITATLQKATKLCADRAALTAILQKASLAKGLDPTEACALLLCRDIEMNDKIFSLTNSLKKQFYGNRIVLFAPLYLSNYCVNSCTYCPYHAGGEVTRKKLSQADIERETKALILMGHKRLALETGEDPRNSPLSYVLDSIKTIYSVRVKNCSIRRVNVNIAATTTENYKALKAAGIGTYILFQETYDRTRYGALHPTGPKHDYDYHTTAMDRAMQGGIDDVGLGVLFGLSDYKRDFAALLFHARHLEETFNCGPHTVSVPRIRRATGINTAAFPDAVSDDEFCKIVACVRLALPYTGIIVSTRESQAVRARVLPLGVSQISGGSRTSVGGYCAEEAPTDTAQFDTSDKRTLDEVVAWLLSLDHIPSFCTACYRSGRQGERFMSLVKSGQIANCCLPNALLTLREYQNDFAGPATKSLCEKMIEKELQNIPMDRVRQKCQNFLTQIDNGERDFCF